MAAIHYRFKNVPGEYRIGFDGAGMQVAELKRQIVQQSKMNRGPDFDLLIKNEQTNEEYTDDNAIVPRGSSVIVLRVPATKPGGVLQAVNAAATTVTSAATTGLPRPVGGTEEQMLAAMQESQTAIDPRTKRPRGVPPPTYQCRRCGDRGHYDYNCPTQGNPEYDAPKIKKMTGIPRTFLQQVDSSAAPGAMILEGGYVRAVPQAHEFHKHATTKLATNVLAELDEAEAPPELQCPICKKLLNNATQTPCCGRSFCDKCIRDYLVENDLTCFLCKVRPVMLDRLLPNEPKRKSVEEYRQRFVTARAAALAPVPAPAATPTAVPTVLAPSATPAAPRPNLRPPQQSAPRSINVYQDADRPIRKPTATGTAVPIMPMAPAPYVWQGMPAMPSPGLQAMFGQQTMYRPPMGVPTTYAPRPGTLPSQPPTATSASHKRPRDESD